MTEHTDRRRSADGEPDGAADEAARVRAENAALREEVRRLRALVDSLGDARHSAERLRISERRLRAFFESGMVGAIYWTIDGRITDANDKFLQMVGYTREDLAAGRVDWEKMTPPEYASLDAHALDQLKATGVDTPYEKEYIRKDGTRVPVIVGAAMLDEARHEGVAFVLDISERKGAEEAQRQNAALLSAMLDALPVSVIIADRTGRLVRMNKASEAIWGPPPMSQNVAAYREWAGYWPETGRRVEPDEWPLSRAVLRGESPVGVRIDIERFDGRGRRSLELSAAPVRGPGGEVLGGVVACMDVTERLRAEETLRESTSLLQAISDTTGDVIFAKDLRGRLTFANPATLKLIGKPLEQVLGRTDAELLQDKEAARRVMTNDARIMASGVAEDLEELVPLPDGARRVWFSRKMPYRDERGAVVGLLGVSRDITERKQAEEDRARLASQRQVALDAARMGWWHYDPQTRIATFDRRYTEIFGVSGTQRPNDEILKRIHPDDLGPLWARVEAALNPADPKPYAAEYRVIRDDGSVRWVEAHGLASFEGTGASRRAVSLVGTVADVTERKEAEQALQQAKEAAEAASKAKDQLLAVVSHELRTPLNPIMAIASYLQDKPDLPGEVREDIATIRRNVEHEARIVDDLLSLTRLSRGKIVLHQEAVDLHALVRAVVGQFQPQMEARRIELLVSLKARPHHVWADPGRLQQVLSNLLDNAVKFTPDDGRITVRSATEPGGRIRLEVTDTGVGIEPDVLARLFSPFEQGEKTVTRRFGGLGLGLVIAKGIVDLHGGTISARSEGQGRGATLAVELAALPAFTDMPSPVSEPALEAGRHQRILLVEDHPDTRRVMARLLTSLGHSVLTAASVAEAMAMIDAEEFDLLVSDIGLPDGSGLEIMRELKRRKNKKGIALSGFGHAEDIQRSREAGFVDHLVKPVNFQVLDATLRRIAN